MAEKPAAPAMRPRFVRGGSVLPRIEKVGFLGESHRPNVSPSFRAVGRARLACELQLAAHEGQLSRRLVLVVRCLRDAPALLDAATFDLLSERECHGRGLVEREREGRADRRFMPARLPGFAPDAVGFRGVRYRR